LRNENCRCRNSKVLAKFNNRFSLNRFLKSRVSKSPEPGNRRGLVGGDYFDVIRLSESKIAICIADVVGKSVSAALLMANVEATVRAFATDSSSMKRLENGGALLD